MPALTALRGEAFPIGQLSKRCGVKIETIRLTNRINICESSDEIARPAHLAEAVGFHWQEQEYGN
jgi:hypothetical protein